MGSLYQRGAVWWFQYRQHGKLMRESSGSSKERVARRMLRSREGDVEHGIPIVTTRDRVGDRYVLEFEIEGSQGKGIVRSIWIVRRGERAPRLTSCFVK